MEGAVVCVFVTVVTAIVISVARPHPRNAFSVLAVELAGVAGVVLGRAHSSLIHRLGLVVTLALSLSVESWMAALGASTVVLVAGICLADLSCLAIDVNVTRRVFEPLDHLDHVGAGVLLGTIDTSQLKISPVNVVPKHRDGERINRSSH